MKFPRKEILTKHTSAPPLPNENRFGQRGSVAENGTKIEKIFPRRRGRVLRVGNGDDDDDNGDPEGDERANKVIRMI